MSIYFLRKLVEVYFCVLSREIYLLFKEVLAETSTNSFSEYSNNALADMIINLSRFEGNEEEIQMVKDELAKRKAKK